MLVGVKICVFTDQKLSNYYYQKLNKKFNCQFFSFNHCAFKYLRNNNHNYDLIIIKVNKSSLYLKKCLTSLKTKQINLPIFLHLKKSYSSERASYLKMGVKDCFSGQVCYEELLIRIKLFSENKANLFELRDGFFWQDFHFCFKSKMALCKEKEIKLNKKEVLLLEELLKRSNRVVPRSILYEKIWQNGQQPKSNSLETYICSLRKKLNKKCGFQLIKTVCGIGYKIKIPPKKAPY